MRVAAVALGVCLLVTSGRARADIDLWPLLEVTDDSTTVLYPLYVHEDPFLMLFPLYYRTNEGQDHHLLWPFLKVSEGRLARVAPLWFSEEEDSFTLFPLVKRTPEYTAMLVPPLYLARDDSFQALIPLYVRSARGSGDDDLWIAWRLFGWHRRGDTRTLHAGYLFSDWSGADESGSYLFPLYYWSRGDDRRTLVLLNYYQKWEPERRTTALFPIFSAKRWKTGSSFYLFPYSQTRDSRRSSTAVFPLFSSTSWGDRAREGGSALSILWPFFRREERFRAGELDRRYRGFLIFSDERLANGTRRLRILGFLVSEETGS